MKFVFFHKQSSHCISKEALLGKYVFLCKVWPTIDRRPFWDLFTATYPSCLQISDRYVNTVFHSKRSELIFSLALSAVN